MTDGISHPGPSPSFAPWLAVALLCVGAAPLLLLLANLGSEDTGAPLFAAFTLLITSLIASLAGFVSGPIAVAWCSYLAIGILIVGLSPEHQYALCCTSKNRFESGLAALFPVFMFPGAVTSTYLVTTRPLLKRRPQPAVAALLVIVSALVSFGALSYFETLERNVACSAVKCNFG